MPITELDPTVQLDPPQKRTVTELPNSVKLDNSVESPKIKNEQISPALSSAVSQLDVVPAALQGVSPNIEKGAKLAPAEEQWKFLELGQPSNQQKYVALRSPETGQYAVYERTPEMSESRFAGLGRMFGLGIPESGIPAVAGAAIPSAAQKLLPQFEAMGVTPNLPAVGQGRSAGLMSQIANTLPIVGPQVRAGVQRTLSDTASAVERTASQLGRSETLLEAGGVLQGAVNKFASETFPNQAEKLYSDFGRHMNTAASIQLPNTLQALKTPMERFPTSPELGAQLTNPTLRGYSRTLEPATKEIPAKFSSLVNEFGNPIVTKAAEKLETGGVLSFKELSELRSTIGRKLGDPVLMSDIPRADLKRVYSAISKDMEDAARAQGPTALQAFQRANKFYRAGIERIDRIEPLLKGSPEQSFNKINQAAGRTGTADSGLLEATRKSMAPAEWRDVGSVVIRKLGEPTPGAKDVLSETPTFSASTFATNWNKLSDAAKDSLFGPKVSTVRNGLETLANISQAQKNIGKLANVSRSGEFGLWGLLAAMGIEHHSSLIAHPFLTVGTGAAAYGASKVLMSPGFARWLYQMPKMVSEAPTPLVGAQRAIAALDQSLRPTSVKPESPTAMNPSMLTGTVPGSIDQVLQQSGPL